jgi:hypothetical protein
MRKDAVHIYDVVLFHSELDMLEIRLNEMCGRILVYRLVLLPISPLPDMTWLIRLYWLRVSRHLPIAQNGCITRKTGSELGGCVSHTH